MGRRPADRVSVRAWIFRNRQRLEAIYGRAGRPRPLTEPAGPEPATGEAPRLPSPHLRPHRPWPERVRVYDLVPAPTHVRRAG